MTLILVLCKEKPDVPEDDCVVRAVRSFDWNACKRARVAFSRSAVLFLCCLIFLRRSSETVSKSLFSTAQRVSHKKNVTVLYFQRTKTLKRKGKSPKYMIRKKKRIYKMHFPYEDVKRNNAVFLYKFLHLNLVVSCSKKEIRKKLVVTQSRQ